MKPEIRPSSCCDGAPRKGGGGDAGTGADRKGWRHRKGLGYTENGRGHTLTGRGRGNIGMVWGLSDT